MSKASRRRQRQGTPPPASRPTGAQPPSTTGGGSSAASTASGGAGNPGPSQAGGAGSAAAATTAGAAASTRPAGSTRPTSTTRPTGSRAGRRERQRAAYQPSFLERYRTAILAGAVVLGVVLISGFVFFSASQPAFACSTVWTPSPTASPSAGATPNLGYAQPDMGHQHVNPGDKVTYTYCAPASGNHINRSGQGPIAARVYGPGDNVIPQGWIHNLEHGGIVVLYRGDSPGATAEGQAQLREFHSAFPPVSDCGPVIARFDQMSTPYQAIIWGRVLLLDTWDPTMVTAFWNQWGGRTNPEPLCPTPNSQTSPSPSAPAASEQPSAPSSSAPASASPLPSASPVASPAASPS